MLFPQKACSVVQQEEEDRRSTSNDSRGCSEEPNQDEPIDSVNTESSASVPVVYMCGQFAAPPSAEVAPTVRSNKRADRNPSASEPSNAEPKAKKVL